MVWNVYFSRKRYAYWLSPGYHSGFERLVGQTVSTVDGRLVRLVNVEYNVEWNQMTRPQKKSLQMQYGEEVKKLYHRFTRITLDKVLWEQAFLPMFDE